MRWLLVIPFILVTTILPAQTTPPENMVTSAEISDTERIISFRISWKDAPSVDSTVIAVFISSDTVPIILRKGRSPDTLTFSLPDDTTTYRFDLYSFRRGLVSLPANANFHFKADEYYQLAKLHIWPKEVSLYVGEQVQLCAFFELNDGSILMRAQDNSKPTCVERYKDYPQNIKRNWGARQRVVNNLCLEWSVGGNNPAREDCQTP
jgi:hypothetical protein